jgi:hypothetical protein
MWIDEVQTWQLAQSESLARWWEEINKSGTNSEQLLYHLYMYYWIDAFGPDAWFMRLSNMPLIVIANVCLLYPFRRSMLLIIAVTLAACLTRISQTSIWIACRFSAFEPEIKVLQPFDL